MAKLDKLSPCWTKWTVSLQRKKTERDRVLCHSIPLISLLPTQKIELNTAARLENGGNGWGGKKGEFVGRCAS